MAVTIKGLGTSISKFGSSVIKKADPFIEKVTFGKIDLVKDTPQTNTDVMKPNTSQTLNTQTSTTQNVQSNKKVYYVPGKESETYFATKEEIQSDNINKYRITANQAKQLSSEYGAQQLPSFKKEQEIKIEKQKKSPFYKTKEATLKFAEEKLDVTPESIKQASVAAFLPQFVVSKGPALVSTGRKLLFNVAGKVPLGKLGLGLVEGTALTSKTVEAGLDISKESAPKAQKKYIEEKSTFSGAMQAGFNTEINKISQSANVPIPVINKKFSLRGFAYNIPLISYLAGDKTAFQEGVRNYYKKRGLGGMELQNAVNAATRQRNATFNSEAVASLAINTYSELWGRGKIAGKPATYGSIFKDIGQAGIIEGAASELAAQKAKYRKTDVREIIGGGAIGGLTAGSLGAFIGMGPKSKSPFVRRSAKVTQIGTYILDPYEKPGDLTADLIQKLRRTRVKTIKGPTLTNNVKGGKTISMVGVQPEKPKSPVQTQTETKVNAQTKILSMVGVQPEKPRGPVQTNTLTQTETPTDTETETNTQTQTNINTNTQTQAQIDTGVPTSGFPLPGFPFGGGSRRGKIRYGKLGAVIKNPQKLLQRFKFSMPESKTYMNKYKNVSYFGKNTQTNNTKSKKTNFKKLIGGKRFKSKKLKNLI